MNRKKINKLIAASYKDNYIDQKVANRIASVISRSDLKKYIDGLKTVEKKRSLIVSSPSVNFDLIKFRELFPDKKIILKKDPSLMLGARIVDNDIVYEFTLRNSFDKILSYIEQNYD